MPATFGPYSARVARIHDGDTIDVDLELVAVAHLSMRDHDLGFNVHRTPAGVVLEDQSVRFYGCNAPELATDAGKAALAFLETVLKVGDVVTLTSHGWDKYGGRIDGTLTLAGGRDLVDLMCGAGHAAYWDGHGPKPVPAG